MRTSHRFLAVAASLSLCLLAYRANAQVDFVAQARSQASADRRSMGPSLELGRVLHRAGSLPDALAELRRGLNLRPASSDQPALIRRELALVLADLGKLNDALRYCQQIGSVGGARVLVHGCAAEVHMARKRASDAFVEAQKALALVPDHYESNLVQGLARWQNGETAESERFFRLAIAKDDSRADAHLGLGRLLLTLARTDEGIAELTKAHAADEQNPEASYALASALGSDAKVQSLLESAVQVRPGFGHAHAKLAEFFLNAMNWDAAENSARAALACSAPEVEWHALLGMALLRKNQLDPAMSEAETTLRSNPVSATAKLLQGEVYAARGDIDLAIEAFQASYSNARTVPTALIRGAEACLRAGRETTARAFAEKATQTFANWGPGWVVFGDILARAGEKSQAREAYRHALSADGPVDKTAVARKIDQLR